MVAGPGGKEVGRVSVRVLPDTHRFGEELAAELKAIQRLLKVEIPTTLEASGAQADLAKLQTKLRSEADAVKIPVQVDRARARDAIQKAVTSASGKVTVPVAIDQDTFSKSILAEARKLGRQAAVNIPATVDGEELRRRLQRAISLVEASAAVQVPVDVEGAAAVRAKLNRQLALVQRFAAQAGVKVPVLAAEPDDFQRQVEAEVLRVARAVELKIPATIEGERLRADISEKITEIQALTEVDIPVDIKEAAAFRAKVLALVAEVELLARRADPKIKVRVDVDEGASRARQALDGITGAATNLFEALGSLTRVRLSQLGTVGTQLALVSSRAVAYATLLGPPLVLAVSGALALGPALATTLPILGSLAAGIGVVVLGMDSLFGDKRTTPTGQKRSGGVFAELNQQVSDLQFKIGSLLTAGITPLVHVLSTTTFPAFTRGMQEVAQGVNAALRQFLAFFTSSAATQGVSRLFDAMHEQLLTLAQAVQPLSSAFLQLAVASLPGMQLLSTAVRDVAIRFANFLQSSAGLSDTITGAVQDTLAFLGGVARLTGELLSLFSALEPVARHLGTILFDALSAGITTLDHVVRTFDLANSSLAGFYTDYRLIRAQLAGIVPVIGQLLSALIGNAGFQTFLRSLSTLLVSTSRLLTDFVIEVLDMATSFVTVAGGPILGFLTGVANALSSLTKFLDQHMAILGLLVGMYATRWVSALTASRLATRLVIPAVEGLTRGFRAVRLEIASQPPRWAFLDTLGAAMTSVRSRVGAAAASLRDFAQVNIGHAAVGLADLSARVTTALSAAGDAAKLAAANLRTFGLTATSAATLDALVGRITAIGAAAAGLVRTTAATALAPFIARLRAVGTALLGMQANIQATAAVLDNWGVRLLAQPYLDELRLQLQGAGTALRNFATQAAAAARSGVTALVAALRALAVQGIAAARGAIAALVAQLRVLAGTAAAAARTTIASLATAVRNVLVGAFTAALGGVRAFIGGLRALLGSLITVETAITAGLAVAGLLLFKAMSSQADATNAATEAVQKFVDTVDFDAMAGDADVKLQQLQDNMAATTQAAQDWYANTNYFQDAWDIYFGGNKGAAAASGADASVNAFALAADQARHVGANLRELQKRTGLSRESLKAFARTVGADLTKPLSLSEGELQKVTNGLADLSTAAGLSQDVLTQVAGNDAAAIQALSKDIEAYVQTVQQAFAKDLDVLGNYSSSAKTDATAVANSHKALVAAQTAAAQAQARLNNMRHPTVAARQAVENATKKAADAQTAYNKALATQQGNGLEASYQRTIRLVQDFAKNLQTAVSHGLDPSVVAKLLAQGPAKAAPILQQLVADTSGHLIQVVNEGEKAMDRFSTYAIQQARITQVAIQAPTDELAREAGRAFQIESLLSQTDDQKMTSQEVAKALGLDIDSVRKIAQDFGITLTDIVPQQLTGMDMKVDVTVDGRVIKLNLFNDPNLSIDYDLTGGGVPDINKTLGITPPKAHPPMAAFAQGGYITGPGGPTSDSILARLSHREFVHPAHAVQYYGVEVMEALRFRRIPREVLRSLAFGSAGLAAKVAATSVRARAVAAPPPPPAPPMVRVSTGPLEAVSAPQGADTGHPRTLTVVDHDGVFRGQMRVAAMRSHRDREKAARLARLGTWGS